MKKVMVLAAAAAIFLPVSCTKDDFKMSKGTPVTVEIGTPATDGDTPTLKVSHSFNEGTGKHEFTWEAGDEIMLIAYPDLKEGKDSDANRVVTCFSTVSGGASAVFTGDLGASYADSLTKVWAVYPKFTPTSISFDKSKGRLKIGPPNSYVLPAVQDGTGYKYCVFASTNGELQTESGVTTFKKAPSFSLSNALLHFSVSSATPVKCITITVENAYSVSNPTGLVGKPGFVSSTNKFNSGCETKTLTVVNDGAALENVTVATRKIDKISSPNTTLTFKCYSGVDADDSNLLFTRVMTLTSSVSYGNIYNLGTLQAK